MTWAARGVVRRSVAEEEGRCVLRQEQLLARLVLAHPRLTDQGAHKRGPHKAGTQPPRSRTAHAYVQLLRLR